MKSLLLYLLVYLKSEDHANIMPFFCAQGGMRILSRRCSLSRTLVFALCAICCFLILEELRGPAGLVQSLTTTARTRPVAAARAWRGRRAPRLRDCYSSVAHRRPRPPPPPEPDPLARRRPVGSRRSPRWDCSAAHSGESSGDSTRARRRLPRVRASGRTGQGSCAHSLD